METPINGISLSYADDGLPNGPPIVFLHGFPFSRAMWQDQIVLLRDRFRIITYDHRGLGQSGLSKSPYPLEFLVDDLFGLLDYLKIDQAIMAGLSTSRLM